MCGLTAGPPWSGPDRLSVRRACQVRPCAAFPHKTTGGRSAWRRGSPTHGATDSPIPGRKRGPCGSMRTFGGTRSAGFSRPVSSVRTGARSTSESPAARLSVFADAPPIGSIEADSGQRDCLSTRPARATLARPLRRALRHGRGEHDLLPAPVHHGCWGVGRTDAGGGSLSR